ncbi:bifunctional alpha/beta hydrolase/OsmC family protein [Lacinutrix sp. Bg11-31]|uniref:bifunctional alpha/beta hydrolase/OsmC family protein n=1 Tax=Lacinutrix sp. Bg11-31 TaxID=2057808 RepID=UPI000C30E1EE|nr:bifunctional alpha/beta hydrolase/OsmC family protein [Lacinutrix sp. Bg11-31]AUC80970.1 osmotically inducible protein C [Lacinutrix sp. Bg11-31]
MNIQKINFTNAESQQLVGRLELPINQHPHNFAIFAHCFTCNKNLSAVKNITRELTSNGFGVLRFDFTGLGESEGDFENTNFSGNVEDLISASNYLKENYTAPTLLIGHSLGGAAAIFAAAEIESIKAVATIGAPSNPKHVQNLIQSSVDEIKTTGKANVNIGGRPFTIKKQFLDDIETKSLPDVAKNLRKAILVMHSPQDATVGIENAEEIYVSARHPKSFVSLDGADHLLMRKEDSIYVGSVIATWAKRYISIPNTETISTSHQAVASLDAEDGFTTQMTVGSHTMMADEPTSYGGNDFGPSPYELVSAGLSACTAMTVQMYTKRKGWDLENIEVHTSHSKVPTPILENDETKEIQIDTFSREIKLKGNLDDKQILRVLQIANKCPVHKTLHSDIEVVTKLV